MNYTSFWFLGKADCIYTDKDRLDVWVLSQRSIYFIFLFTALWDTFSSQLSDTENKKTFLSEWKLNKKHRHLDWDNCNCEKDFIPTLIPPGKINMSFLHLSRKEWENINDIFSNNRFNSRRCPGSSKWRCIGDFRLQLHFRDFRSKPDHPATPLKRL